MDDLTQARGNTTAHLASELLKAGRRWVTARSDGWWRPIRFDKLTGEADDANFGWQLFADADGLARAAAERERENRLREAWEGFKGAVHRHYSRPEHLSLEQIVEMTAALTLPAPPAKEPAR